MSELTLLVLRIAFLILLWGFVFFIVYTLRTDLFGPRARRMPEQAQQGTFPSAAAAPAASGPAQTPPAPAPAVGTPTAATTQVPRGTPAPSDRTERRLVITSGPRAGMEIELTGEQLTIGRSSESGLVIRDDYTSTHHARLMLWNDQWVVQDLDSTNGTFLDGQRVSLPTPVPSGSSVTIGKTSFELRR
jgi:hypothetical protein